MYISTAFCVHFLVIQPIKSRVTGCETVYGTVYRQLRAMVQLTVLFTDLVSFAAVSINCDSDMSATFAVALAVQLAAQLLMTALRSAGQPCLNAS